MTHSELRNTAWLMHCFVFVYSAEMEEFHFLAELLALLLLFTSLKMHDKLSYQSPQ